MEISFFVHPVLFTLQWRHIERDGVSNQQRLDCSLNRFLGADERKHQSSASLAFVRGTSLHKGPATRKIFPFDNVITYVVNWIINVYEMVVD